MSRLDMIIFIFTFALVKTIYCQGIVGQYPRYRAIARIKAADQYETYIGQLQFVQYDINGPTTIVGMLNFPPNYINTQYIGMHIHEYGDVSESCKWVGQHYNPYRTTHGGPGLPVRHTGDLGNINPQGNMALLNITDHEIKLTGMTSVIGRSIVVHARLDDYGRGGSSDSLVDGNTGYPMACGVIGIKGDFSPATASSIGPCKFLISIACLLMAMVLRRFY